MKKLLTLLLATSFLTCGAMADDTAVDDKGGKGSGAFTGEITAVENGRDSFTVVADNGQVRMFAISAGQKGKLSVGQRVRVSYVNQYSWPLPTRSITIIR